VKYKIDDNKSLVTYPVSRELNGRKYHLDGEDAIARVEYSELQPLLIFVIH